nr:retrovirus-related Pol polyprotein from transposon TNT 1-94 [Tanacetum cinerariifolium]GFA54505.1 retrovirus-related Pol polyprotein from transposon TNT 1-94 [Tanacetum cinerariifolium]
LILAHERPSDTKDTKIAALRLKFNAFKALEEEKVNGTFNRLKCLLNDIKNNDVSISQAEESVSSEDEGVTKVKAFMAITEEEPSVGKANARSGGRGKRKEQTSLKEVLFTKADESPTETTHEITFDSEPECDIQESLPPLPNLLRAEPIGASTNVLTMADLTQTLAVSEEIKK